MKTTSTLLLGMLVCCTVGAAEESDPFTPPPTGVDVPPRAMIDPFPPAIGDDKHDELEDPHRWVDKVVKPGSGDGPNYIKIGGWRENGQDRVGILFRVDLKQYNDAIRHTDHNRGVALISGRPEAPDLCTWLRPFLVAGDRAEFVVTGSRKQLETMCLAFIPHEGNQRYLYSLKGAAQDIIEKVDKGQGNQPDQSPLPTGRSSADSTTVTPP